MVEVGTAARAWHGGWRSAGWRGGGWGWNRGWNRWGWNNGWGWGGLGLGLAGLGYGYGYGYPYDYGYGYGSGLAAVATAPLTTGRSVAVGGNYCATPVRTCLLYHSSWVGNGCSCKVYGGRARGSVE